MDQVFQPEVDKSSAAALPKEEADKPSPSVGARLLKWLTSEKPQMYDRSFAHLGSPLRIDPALDRDAQAPHSAKNRQQFPIDVRERVECFVAHGAQVPLDRPAARGLEVEQSQPGRSVEPVPRVRAPVKWTTL